MKRLLLLTDAPAAPLYAPRMRYLLSNLARRGWQCTVVSEKMPDTDFAFADCRHLQFPYYSDKQGLGNKIRWMADKICNRKERLYYRFITQHVDRADADCILCSAFHTFPLPTAARLARHWQLPLIADLRDLAEQWGETPYMQHPIRTPLPALNSYLTDRYTRLSIRQRNAALRTADELVTISPWHQKVLQQIHPSVHLIYNGYDEQTFRPNDIRTDTFNITYTGKIYDFRLRDPQLLFRALGELKQGGRLPDKVQVHFYCEQDIRPRLNELAEQYDILQLVHLHDFVRNDEIIDILWQSSVCVILTNSPEEQGTHGIMTTKFFEALGVEKPVLCVRSDEECLAEVIRTTHAGIAATTADEVKAFILDKYAEWQANGFTRQAVLPEQRLLFTRDHQAQQFEELLQLHIHD